MEPTPAPVVSAPSLENCGQLRGFPAPVVDRASLETLLHVSRRDTIRLLHRFGGYQAGRTFLIGRPQLAHALEAVLKDEPYHLESPPTAPVR